MVLQTSNGHVRRNQRITRRVIEGRPPVSPLSEGYESCESPPPRERPDVPSALGASHEDYGELTVPEGNRVGAVVRALASHQCVPGSIPGPGVICGLSLLLVLYSAPRGFSPGTPVFPSPQKPTFSNSNLIWECTATFERVL